MYLLLGFEDRYNIEGSEKLNYLTARLGDEIAHMKGQSAGFAPHAARPYQIVNKLRNDAPLWVLCSVFGLIGALGFMALHTMLDKSTGTKMNAYNDIVKLAPHSANLTITLHSVYLKADTGSTAIATDNITDAINGRTRDAAAECRHNFDELTYPAFR